MPQKRKKTPKAKKPKKITKQKTIGLFLIVVFITVVIALLLMAAVRVFTSRSFPVDKLSIQGGSVSARWDTRCRKDDWVDTWYADSFCVRGRIENQHDQTAYAPELRFDVKQNGQPKETITHDYCVREVQPNGVAEFACVIMRRPSEDPAPNYEVTVTVKSAKFFFQDMLWEIADDLLCKSFINYCRL